MFKEKLEIARKLCNSSDRFSKNSEHRKLVRKCILRYVIDCIFKSNNCFKLKFKNTISISLIERIKDWYKYINKICYKLYLIFFKPNNALTSEDNDFIHSKIPKPRHIKTTNEIDELMLKSYLKRNDFKIVKTIFYSKSKVYYIAHIARI